MHVCILLSLFFVLVQDNTFTIKCTSVLLCICLLYVYRSMLYLRHRMKLSLVHVVYGLNVASKCIITGT